MTKRASEILREVADELDSRWREPGGDERGSAAGLLRTRAIAEERAEAGAGHAGGGSD